MRPGVLRQANLPGSGPGISFLFKPDWSKVTPQTFLAALGQAFFSLSLGGVIATFDFPSADVLMLIGGLLAIAFFQIHE